jgi:hypothetical protein
MDVKALCDKYYKNPPLSFDEIKNARLHTIYKIGQRILKENERKMQFLEKLGKDLGYSSQELYRCVRLVQKYPDFEKFKAHSALS